MFSTILKIKIHPRLNIKRDLTQNLFTESIALTEHNLKSQNGMFSKLQALFDKSSGSLCYVATRNMSGPHKKNPPQPIREPNTPKSKIKKDKEKEDRKSHKPAVYANKKKRNISDAEQTIVHEMKNIFNQKWGVKSVKDVAPPKSDQPDSTSNAEVPKKTIGYNESTALDTEYEVPADVKEGGESKLWKSVASKSTHRAIEKGSTSEELQVNESIFIQPEPPTPKSDERSIQTPDLLP